MTVTVAWVRRSGTARELVFASDSRLTGGETWDRCCKVFLLPRTDCLIAFSGHTTRAFPMLHQMINAIAGGAASRTRQLPIAKARSHALKVFNEVYSDLRDLPVGDATEIPDVHFTFGGWDWKSNSFDFWSLEWNVERGRFWLRSVIPRGSTSLPSFWFDGTRDAAKDASAALKVLIQQEKLERLDDEPLQILTAIMRDESYRDVGGVPQVARVLSNSTSDLCVCRWRSQTGGAERAYFSGRPVLEYEKLAAPIVQADRFEPTEAVTSALDQVRQARRATEARRTVKSARR